MSRQLDAFARRLAADPAFLASALADYARSEDLDEPELADALGCSVDILTRLRLCLRPRSDRFEADVQEIATRFGVDADALTKMVRRADVLAGLRQGRAAQRGMLMAARDREEPPAAPEEAPPP